MSIHSVSLSNLTYIEDNLFLTPKTEDSPFQCRDNYTTRIPNILYLQESFPRIFILSHLMTPCKSASVTQYADEHEHRHVLSKFSGVFNDSFNVPESFDDFYEELDALQEFIIIWSNISFYRSDR